jgi:hypothetical protein
MSACPPSSSNPCPSYPNAKCVYYGGSNLLCTGIKTNDRLDVILQKIDALFCNGGGGGGGGSFVVAGTGIDVNGVGTLGNPYIISSVLQANNGLTLGSSIMKFGQTVGQTGNPGAILHNTEVPMGDFSIIFNNKTGTGAPASAITINGGNSSGTSRADIKLEAINTASVKFSVDNTAGNMQLAYYGLNGLLEGSGGYFVSGAGGHFYLSNMTGGTTHSTVEIGGVASQQWNITGDTALGLYGTRRTGFGGVTTPTAHIDIIGSTVDTIPLRFQDGVDPSNNYLEGAVWRANNHLYGRLNGMNKQLDNDYILSPGDFIQNQFTTSQSTANFWIDGHGRIDDYLQISNAARLVKDSGGMLSVASPTNSSLGASLRVNQLQFFNPVTPGALSTSYIDSSQGDRIGIHTPGSYGSLDIDSAYISQTKHTTWNMGGVFPLIFMGADSDSTDNPQDFIRIRNNGPAGSDANSTHAFLSFAVNKENGTPINPVSNRGDVVKLARIGVEAVNFSQTLYKGDLVFETVDASVNSGAYTEYFRLKYDGRMINPAYSTLLAAPTTTGVKHLVTCDEGGLFSHEVIPVGGVGSVTSVALSMPSAFSVANSPITNAGTLVVTATGTTSQYIRGDGSLGSVPISVLTAATASNSINNANFAQTWNWNSLSTQTGLLLQTSSTLAASNAQTLLWVNMFGLNANSNQITYGAIFANSHTGTGSTNIGASFSASGGATNIAAQFISGSVNLGVPGTSLGVLNISGNTSGTITIQPAAVAGTYTLTLPTSAGTANQILKTDGSGVLSWSSSALNTPLSGITAATTANTINNLNFAQTWRWNTLVSGAGLALTVGSASASTGSRVLDVILSTTNNQATYAAHIRNNGVNAGSNTALYLQAVNSTIQNVGLYIDASGGSDNQAITIVNGKVTINSFSNLSTQDRLIGQYSSNSVLGYISVGAGLTLSGGVLSSSGSSGNVYTIDGTVTDSVRTVDVNNNSIIFNNVDLWAVYGKTAYAGVGLLGVNGDTGFAAIGDIDTDINGTQIRVTDNVQEITLINTNVSGTFFKIAGFGSASNGDVLTLADNTTGRVSWSTPGGGGGGVTSFSAGTFSPLFTTSVATATTTPALSFTASNASANTWFGNNTGSPAPASFNASGALTKTDDANVTLTLGGSPTTALLNAASITVGWTGTLGVARGGTNLASYTIGDILYASGTTTLSKLGIGTSGQILRVNAGVPQWYTQTFNSGTVTDFSAGDLAPLFTTTEATTTTTPALSFTLTNAGANTYFGNATGGSAAPSYTAAGALTTGSDTNIVLTVGGNASTSLLRAASITASWNGTLGVARGGTNIASYAIGDILFASGTTTLSKLAIGAPGQQLRVNGGGTALEYFTAGPGITTLNTLTAATQLFAVGTSGTDFNISSVTDTHTFNIPSAGIGITRGLITNSAQTLDGVKSFNLGVNINSSGVNTAAGGDFVVQSDTNTDAIHVDATNNRVGILTAPGAFGFDVAAVSTRIQGNLGVGTSPNGSVALTIGGSSWTAYGLNTSGVTLSPTANANAAIGNFGGTIVEAASGTHAILATLWASPFTDTAGLAVVTNACTVYISDAPTAVGATNSALFIAAGAFRANGDWFMGVGNAYASGGYDYIVRNRGNGRLESIDPDVIAINTQSAASYTLVLTDKGKLIERTNAGAQSVTIPTNASVAFPIGTMILIEQTGAGQVTFTPAVGVTMNAADASTKTRTQWVVATLIKKATNTWTLSGDIIP